MKEINFNCHYATFRQLTDIARERNVSLGALMNHIAQEYAKTNPLERNQCKTSSKSYKQN